MRFEIITLNISTREITFIGDLTDNILPNHSVKVVDGNNNLSLAPPFTVSSVISSGGMTTITTNEAFPPGFTPASLMFLYALHYIVDYSDITKSPLLITPYHVDTSTSLSLMGRGVTNYGEVQNENVLHLLENFSSSTAPLNPIEGQLWYNSDTSFINFYNGSDWNAVGTPVLIPPTNPATGTLWYDASVSLITPQLKIFNGAVWESVSNLYVPLSGGTMTGFLTLHANPTNNSHAASKRYVDDTVSSGIATHASDLTIHITPVQNTLLDGIIVSASDINTLSGINSNVQSQINTKENANNKGVANGYASLDVSGLVPTTQLPSYVDDVLEYANLAGFPVSGETGKIYVAMDTNKTYRWSGSAYVYITSGAVDSVAGKTGVVTLVKADVGLGNVDNTSDVNKPVSTAQQTALNLKANIASPTFTGTVSGIDKMMVGLGNVDNTSDVNKPVSTATQTALNLKANLASPDLTGIPTAPTADPATDTNQIATTAFVKAQGFSTGSGVTSVSGTAPVVSSGGTTPTISMSAATASVNGYMTSGYASKLDGIESGAQVNTVTSVAGKTGIVTLVKADVGLSDVDNTADTAKPVSTAQQTALNLKANIASPVFTGTVSGIDKTMVGLGNVDNTADTAKPVSTATQTALNAKQNSLGFTPENVANKGVAGGYASLDGAGLVPATQLPSYVDDVLEYVNLAGFPVTGETGKIYVAIDTSLAYRWSGSTYVAIASAGGGGVTSVAGKTGIVTLVKADVGLSNVDNTADTAKPVSTAQQTAINLKANIDSPVFTGNVTGLGVAAGTSFNAITGLSISTPLVAGTAAVGTGTTAARADHVHPKQTVVTADIVANAVTTVVTNNIDAELSLTNGVWTDASSISITSTGGIVEVITSISVRVPSNGLSAMGLKVLRGATTIFQAPNVATPSLATSSLSVTGGGLLTAHFVDPVAAGTYTYTVQVYSSNVASHISYRKLAVMEIKR